MERRLIGIILGIASSLVWPHVPSLATLLILGAAGLLLAKSQPLLSSVLIGISYCAALINMQFNDIQYLKLQNSSIIGTIISLPEQRKFNNRFFFKLSEINTPHITRKSAALLLVYWPGSHQLMQGQQLKLTIDIRPVHGLANQGGFNYQKWLLSQGIVATARVSNGVIINPKSQIRASLVVELTRQVTDLSHGHLIRALALADKSGFSRPDWQLLTATGTSHLFAISGLHLAIVFGLSFSLMRLALSWSRALTYHQRLVVMTISALLVAFCYSYLAGFSLPTVRALVMLSVLSVVGLLGQRMSLVQLFIYSLATILVFDPLSVLALGFWLSFGAVFFLMILVFIVIKPIPTTKSRFHRFGHKVVALAQMQLWLFGAMCGLQLVFFAGFSWVAPLANLVAVPAISLLVLPVIILGLLVLILLPEFALAGFLFEIADNLLELVFKYLGWLANWPDAWVASSKIQYWLFFIVLLAVLLNLTLINTPRWRIGAALASLLLTSGAVTLWPTQQPAWSVHFLDVGQGNAAVVIRNGRAIVLDTGKSRTSSISNLVILPFLQHQAINQLDYVILSHQDNDHAGGWRELISHFPAAKIISNWPNKPRQQGVTHCAKLQNKPLLWQGLTLSFVMAPPRLARNENDRSCVTKVADNAHAVLFPGDISRKIENYLQLQSAQRWQSDILVVPHHGSKTSSSLAFINFIAPQIAVVSAGRFNQWNFPKPEVLEHYNRAGVKMVNTATDGQISVFFYSDGSYELKRYRTEISPFWYNKYRSE
ncbi:MAG: DNA internalization-related competence protein ComEC/Rec2 [Gammaproteobacteria bacterium]|nr:DNA internalization-related competence protein ComEC/Rec2 [Gammaproteobacteria bacterium]